MARADVAAQVGQRFVEAAHGGCVVAGIALERREVDEVLDDADLIGGRFAPYGERALEHLPRALPFARGAAATPELRVELAALRWKLRFLAARHVECGLHQGEACRSVALHGEQLSTQGQ